jgi:hypothetical protein
MMPHEPGRVAHCVLAQDQLSLLATGQLTPPHNTITVELVQPDGMAAIVRITWPLRADRL